MSDTTAPEATELDKTRRYRRRTAATGDLMTARSCRVAAVAAAVAGVLLAVVHQGLAAGLVLWLVPSLLVVGGLAHRAHTRRTGGRA